MSEVPAESPDENTAAEPSSPRPRLWPAVIAVLLLYAAFIPPRVFPESPKGFMPLFLGMQASYGMLILWWLFGSRTPWVDRLVGFAVFACCITLGVMGAFHPSLSGSENVMNVLFYVAPWLVTVIVVALLLTKGLGWRTSRWVTLLVMLGAFAAAASIRLVSTNSGFEPVFSSRWSMTDEEKLLASLDQGEGGPQAFGEQVEEASLSDWPGFRGAGRDGHVYPGSLAGDWEATPPKELWRRAVGPGWSSFCVVGGVAYTQEQRGEEDCVVAYSADTGEQIWSTGVEDRFYNAVGGAGPRATPTWHAGALYTLGGMGVVQRLDAATGEVAWRRFLLGDQQRGREGVTQLDSAPVWGFSASPLVVDDGAGRLLAVVYANTPKQEPEAPYVEGAVVAFDAESGEVVWKGGVGWHGYSSTHLAMLLGQRQLLSVSNLGIESLDPATGSRLWFYKWDIGEMNRSIQPLVVDDSTVVLSAGYDSGTMVLDIANGDEGWTAAQRWKQPSRALEPYFNDMTLHNGHLFGISKKYLVSIDLETGKATWPRKVKRQSQFGNGQLVLDSESGMLLVTDENSGEVLLIEANPQTLVVRGKLQALEPGVNWNHPVVAGGRLYVRDGVEAVCYELPVSETEEP